MPTPDFVLALRQRIGHAPLWLPGVSAVILRPGSRTLLTRRSDNGRWAIVSGIPEPGEQPAAAITRECLEETGLHPTLVGICGVEAEPAVTFPNGDQCQFMGITFVATVTGEEAERARVADEESTAVGWFPLSDLPEPLAPLSRRRIAAAQEWLASADRAARYAHPDSSPA